MRNDKYRFILHKTSIMIDQQRANLLYPIFKRKKKKRKKSTLKLEINLYQSYKKHRIRRLNSKGLNDGRLSWNHYRPSFNVLPSANIDNNDNASIKTFHSTRKKIPSHLSKRGTKLI